MTKISDLHREWMQDPEYRAAYDALEEEFALPVEANPDGEQVEIEGDASRSTESRRNLHHVSKV